ncbi:MAG TPA: double zinc ribbon domain-containing protein [Candidatus Sulfobium mesophilum]|jgi:hypothetical protein|uniref:Double zinc ribbon domain-containing protein n=1 Tax=Candidatus Sulfobium mesophilum TaxID=2016548 RepID=A0A2U3QEJ2_9BACT|nr:conserved hypothetical protein [Candidatus Sulfobium mesophilum]HSB32734.1 double zinc ribbon domain-containing protein [Candidatus Sulfobium mesophilum]
MNRLLIFVLAGLAGALIADKKGRDRLTWGLVCFFLPPAVFLLFFLPPVLAQGRTKSCPYCKRVISFNDTACRFCKRELPIEMVQCPACGSFVPDKQYCMHCNRKLR